jgi:hypothetical protein
MTEQERLRAALELVAHELPNVLLPLAATERMPKVAELVARLWELRRQVGEALAATPRAAQEPRTPLTPGEVWLVGRGTDGRTYSHVCDDLAQANAIARELGYSPYTTAPTSEEPPELAPAHERVDVVGRGSGASPGLDRAGDPGHAGQ